MPAQKASAAGYGGPRSGPESCLSGHIRRYFAAHSKSRSVAGNCSPQARVVRPESSWGEASASS